MSKFIITIPADREHLANVESLTVCLRAYDVSKVEPLVYDDDDIDILNMSIASLRREIGELTQRLDFTTQERDGYLAELRRTEQQVVRLTGDRTMHAMCDRTIHDLGQECDGYKDQVYDLTATIEGYQRQVHATEDREHELRIALDAKIAEGMTKDGIVDGWVERCDKADRKLRNLVVMVRKHLIDLIDNGSIDEDALFIVNMVEDYGMEPFARDLSVRIEFGPQFYCDIEFEAVPNRIDGDTLATAVGKAIKYLSNADDVANMILGDHDDIEVEVDGHVMTGEFGEATWFPKWEKAYIVT